MVDIDPQNRKFNEDVKTNRLYYRILVIFAVFSFSLCSMIIVRTPIADGYELSIYDSYPSYFWILLCLGIFTGLIVLINQAFGNNHRYWDLVGFLIILIYNVMILSLPFFRGYRLYPTYDALSHLGEMKNILQVGNIWHDDFYPMIHILGVSLIYFTNIKNEGILETILFISFYIMYLTTFYILATMIANTRTGQAILMTAFASPLLLSNLHTLIHPALFSLFLLPMLLYFYHRRIIITTNRIECTIILILLILAVTFSHPVTSIFLIILVLSFPISENIYRKLVPNKEMSNLSKSNNIYGSAWNICFIIIMCFYIWYFSFPDILWNIRDVYLFLMSPGASLFSTQTNTLHSSNISIYHTLTIFINKYGSTMVYIILSVISILILLKRYLYDRINLRLIDFVYAVAFMVSSIFSAYSLFGYTGEFNILRISRFFLFISPLLCGLVIYRSIDMAPKNRRNKYIACLITLIMVLVVLNIYNVYSSPRNADINWQGTTAEIAGAEWFTKFEDKQIIISTSAFKVRNYEDLLLGYYNPAIFEQNFDNNLIPAHFGYEKNDTISKTMGNSERYILLNKADELAFKIFPENAELKNYIFTSNDFIKLNKDPSISSIYENGGLEARVILNTL